MANKIQTVRVDSLLFSPVPIQKPTRRNWNQQLQDPSAAVGFVADAILRTLRTDVTGVGMHMTLGYDMTEFLLPVLTLINLLEGENCRFKLNVNHDTDGAFRLGHKEIKNPVGLVHSLKQATVIDAIQGEDTEANRMLRFMLVLGSHDYFWTERPSLTADLGFYLTPAGFTVFCRGSRIPLKK